MAGGCSHLAATDGTAALVGLLTYPLPIAWLGLGTLVGLMLARWRAVRRPLPDSPFTIPFAIYLAGGLVGLLVSFRSSTAEIRFFGIIAAGAALVLLTDLACSERAARRVVLGGLLLAVAVAPLLAAIVWPYLRKDWLPGLGPAQAAGLLAGLDPIREQILPGYIRGYEAHAVMQRYRLRSSG